MKAGVRPGLNIFKGPAFNNVEHDIFILNFPIVAGNTRKSKAIDSKQEQTYFQKFQMNSPRFTQQEHEDLIIVLNIHRTKGCPLPPPFFQPNMKPNKRQMGMGTGGAVNVMTNSILTNNDVRMVYGLLFMKKFYFAFDIYRTKDTY